MQLLVTDSYGNSRVKNFTITVVELTIASSFDDSVVQSGVLAFPYTPYGSVSKTVHFILDGTELETATTSVSGRQQTYIISAQNHGAHTLRVYFEASINGNTVRSNELYYEIIWARPLVTTPVIASSFSGTNIMQFTTVNIPYGAIASEIGLSKSTVSSFCKKHDLTDILVSQMKKKYKNICTFPARYDYHEYPLIQRSSSFCLPAIKE